MDRTVRRAAIFYGSTLAFSWLFWIAAMTIATRNQLTIPYNEGIYTVFSRGFSSSLQRTVYIIFGLAVYGPIAGALLANLLNKGRAGASAISETAERAQRPSVRWMLFVLVYPVLLFSIAVIASLATTGFSKGLQTPTLPLWFLPWLFLYQLVTSGTEEIGWRGFLQPLLQSKYSAEKSCYLVGLLWSVWHYPFIIYTNYPGGLFLTLLSLVGFTALTVPQAFVMAWLYNSTRSILLTMAFHAWSNTVSFYLFALSPNPQITPIVTAVVTWLIADYLTKRYGKERLSIRKSIDA